MITLSIYRGDVVGSNGKLYPICNMKIYDKINLILGGGTLVQEKHICLNHYNHIKNTIKALIKLDLNSIDVPLIMKAIKIHMRHM